MPSPMINRAMASAVSKAYRLSGPLYEIRFGYMYLQLRTLKRRGKRCLPYAGTDGNEGNDYRCRVTAIVTTLPANGKASVGNGCFTPSYGTPPFSCVNLSL